MEIIFDLNFNVTIRMRQNSLYISLILAETGVCWQEIFSVDHGSGDYSHSEETRLQVAPQTTPVVFLPLIQSSGNSQPITTGLKIIFYSNRSNEYTC
jgi:hypothetical protein